MKAQMNLILGGKITSSYNFNNSFRERKKEKKKPFSVKKITFPQAPASFKSKVIISTQHRRDITPTFTSAFVSENNHHANKKPCV